MLRSTILSTAFIIPMMIFDNASPLVAQVNSSLPQICVERIMLESDQALLWHIEHRKYVVVKRGSKIDNWTVTAVHNNQVIFSGASENKFYIFPLLHRNCRALATSNQSEPNSSTKMSALLQPIEPYGGLASKQSPQASPINPYALRPCPEQARFFVSTSPLDPYAKQTPLLDCSRAKPLPDPIDPYSKIPVASSKKDASPIPQGP